MIRSEGGRESGWGDAKGRGGGYEFVLFFGEAQKGKREKELTQHHHRGVHHGYAGVVLLLRLLLLLPVRFGARE